MAFQYAGDKGVPSYNEIIAFGSKSGITVSVTSTVGGTHVKGSNHYTGNAVDFGGSVANMAAYAGWWIQYAPYLVELIHSGGGGYFVKNGAVVTAGYYGSSTVSQHYNHVHVAATLSGLKAAGAGGNTQQLAMTGIGKTGSGCLVPGAGMLTVAGGLLWGTAEILAEAIRQLT